LLHCFNPAGKHRASSARDLLGWRVGLPGLSITVSKQVEERDWQDAWFKVIMIVPALDRTSKITEPRISLVRNINFRFELVNEEA
jgi:hypothetical protein